jgi:hypothetical protein
MGLAHLRTPKLETYWMGKLAEFIWQENIDVEYFVDSSTMSCFRVQLKETLNPNHNV